MQTSQTFVVAQQVICYEDDIFSIDVKRGKTRTTMYMQVFTSVVNTKHIPTVYSVLKKLLPSVLSSKCFNDDNLPFALEVKATEIGHLFEHILLEYLCQARLLQGAESAVYSGYTSWNWHKDPWGTFHITVKSGEKDRAIFEEALIKTIQLTKFLMLGIRIGHNKYSQFQITPVALKNGKSQKLLVK